MLASHRCAWRMSIRSRRSRRTSEEKTRTSRIESRSRGKNGTPAALSSPSRVGVRGFLIAQNKESKRLRSSEVARSTATFSAPPITEGLWMSVITRRRTRSSPPTTRGMVLTLGLTLRCDSGGVPDHAGLVHAR